MRTGWKWTLVLAVSAIWTTSGFSQQKTIPEPTTVKLLLLRQASVQKELGISPEVAKKITDFTHQQAEEFGKSLKLDEAKRKKAHDEMETQNKKFIADTLNEKQSKRLDQITMQFTALHHLNQPEAVKTLNLTDEQQKKLKALQVEHRKELEEIMFGKAEGRAEKFTKLREKTRMNIHGILTEKQIAQVRTIVGEPFMGEIVIEELKPSKF